MFKVMGLALVLGVLAAGGACAHARLIRAQPRVGATVTASPPELRLLFSESLQPARSSVALSIAGGGPVALGPLAVDPADHRVAIAPVAARLAAGRYRVVWSVTAADGHQTDGDFTFTIAR